MADRDNRIGRARSLGLPPVNRRDKLGSGDLDDLFRVNLLGRSSVDLNLSGVKKANFDVEMYAFKRPVNQIPKKIRNADFRSLKARVRNQYLQLVGASRRKGSRVESIQQTLDAGEYLVRVYQRKGNSRYVLGVNSTAIVEPVPVPVPVPVPTPTPGTPIPTPGTPIPTPGTPIPTPGTPIPTPGTPIPTPGTPIPTPGTPIPTPPPGNSFDTAFTRTLSPTTPLAGTLNDADKVDYYKVTVGRGDYLFATSGLQGKADIEIFNNSRSSIARFTSNVNQPDEKFLQGLDAGTYFIKFTQRTTGTTANYTVTGQKQTDRVSNASNTATALPSLPSTLTKLSSNYVLDGGKDSPVDYHRFRVTTPGFLTVEVRNMFGNLDVEVQQLDSSGAVVQSDIYNNPSQSPVGTYGKGSEVFGGGFQAGDYILKVFTPNGSKIGSTYDLFMSLDTRGTNPIIAKDTNFGQGGSQAKNIVEVGGFAFYSAFDGQKTALYRSNGTLLGTTKIREFASIGSLAIAAGNSLYFVANDGISGSELWRSTLDGTTELVADLAPGSAGASINQIAAVGNSVYFVANPGGTAPKFYRTTGVGATDITAGLAGDSIQGMTAVGNALFFSSEGTGQFAGDVELWRIFDNQNSATRISLNDGFDSSSSPLNITSVGDDTIYLTAVRPGTGGSKRRLVKLTNVFATNANDIGKINLDNYNGGLASPFGTGTSSFNAQLRFVKGATAAQDALYLVAGARDSNGGLGNELFRLVNPLAADANSMVELVKDIRPGSTSSSLNNLVAFNGKLYFTADDGTGVRLWYSDGTANGTQSIAISGVSGGYAPSRLTVVGNTLFLVTNGGSADVELWKTTGTTLNLVQDLNPTGSSNPQNLVKIGNNALFFIANDGKNGLEVWSVGTGS
ncbi:hypothetical protein C7B76_08780 [filamentous cyanobacterium CCP2]|nr:hypothetical protein C7B76_08780 [filamentous cyanobacterium CCP2]